MADFILGYLSPFYSFISDVFYVAHTSHEIKQNLLFDNALKTYTVLNGENSLRSIGFNISSADLEVNNTVFASNKLSKYSFYQSIEVESIPDYDIETYMEISITPSADSDTPFVYSWGLSLNNYCNCTHEPSYTFCTENVHLKSCDSCRYSYYSSHAYVFETYNSESHTKLCQYCGYFNSEAHTLRYTEETEYCMICDYQSLLNERYESNNDGRTHKKIKGTSITIENCFGMTNESGNYCCVKCGQKLKNGLGGGMILSTNEENEFSILADPSVIENKNKFIS